MTHLDLTLFGSPLISIDGAPLHTQVEKAAALVALLALQGPTLPRHALAAYLWTKSDAAKARAALRMAIARLNETAISPWLVIDRDSISLSSSHSLWVDISEFQENLKKSKSHVHGPEIACPDCFPWLERALELYRGDFMAGYLPHNAEGFDEWRIDLSHTLRSEFLTTLERLAKGYYQHGRFDQALHIVRRWLAVDIYNEEAYSLIMRIYASLGQRANAIAKYRSYKQLVEKKLDTEPSADITALYQHILAGREPSVDLTRKLKKPILLLLDIDQASDLWLRHPALKEKVLTRFSQGVRENLRLYGGRIIQQSPHLFSILFEHGHPLQFALAIQHSTGQTKWGLPEPLLVRMAVNTLPDALLRSPFHSSEFATCQLLLDAASGGQLLLTAQATLEMEFPVSARPRDLGTYFIPGKNILLQVFELVHPLFAVTDHQPLRNLSRSPANLPLQATPFIGRETELAHITRFLHQPEVRLLSLVGPSGVGKTRLGIQAISQLEITLPERVAYVPLVFHHNPHNLHQPIAEVLNLSFNNPSDQAAQLIEYLHPQRMLLLLDNFEHLIEGTPFLIQLLQAVPSLRILLTSQERLNLNIETVFEVRGMSTPPSPDDPAYEQYSAVRLFLQNARRVSPGFRIRPQDKAHIIRICTLLDGLPLGIELASAWVRNLSCQEIADSLSKNLDIVPTKRPDLPERHRSLRAAFNHSWGLLSEADRHAITRLSIFSHGFSAEAAKKLADVTPSMLAGYADRSILTSQLPGRHGMPETLRSFILQRLKSDQQEYERLADAHCEYYLTSLANMLPIFASVNGALALKELGLELVNLRAALHWAIDHHHWALFSSAIDPFFTFFELQGRFREGLDDAHALLERLTRLIGMQQPQINHSLSGWEGWFAFCSGYKQEGLEKLNKQLEFAQHQGDFAHVAYTALLLANAYARLGDLEAALKSIEQSLAILEQIPGPDHPLILGIRGNAWSIYGVILILLDRIDQARQVILQAEDALRRSGARYGLIRLLDVQARLANKDDKPEESYNLRLQALAIAEEYNDRRRIADLLNNLAHSAEKLGEWSLAYAHSSRCAQICNELGDRHLSAINNNNLGYLTLQLKKPASEAILYYRKSLAIFREIQLNLGVFYTLRDIARAYLQVGDLDQAHHSLLEALHIGHDLGKPLLVLHLLPYIARLLAKTGRVGDAMQFCSIVLQHPQAEAGLQRDAQELLAELSGSNAAAPHVLPESGEPTLPAFQTLLAVLHEGETR